jgi:hypothetical protein
MTSLFKATREAFQALPRLQRRNSSAASEAHNAEEQAPRTANSGDAFGIGGLPMPFDDQRARLAHHVDASAPYAHAAPAPPTEKPLPARPHELKRHNAVHRSVAAPKPFKPAPIVRKPLPHVSEPTPVDWAQKAHHAANECNIGDDEQPVFERELRAFFEQTSVPNHVEMAVQMVFPGFETPDESSSAFKKLPSDLASAVRFARRLYPHLPHFSSLERLYFFRALSNLPSLAQARAFNLVMRSAPTLFAGAMDDVAAVRLLPATDVADLMQQRARMHPNYLAYLANLHGIVRAAFLAAHAHVNPPPRRAMGRLSVLPQNGANVFKKGVSSPTWDPQTPSD